MNNIKKLNKAIGQAISGSNEVSGYSKEVEQVKEFMLLAKGLVDEFGPVVMTAGGEHPLTEEMANSATSSSAMCSMYSVMQKLRTAMRHGVAWGESDDEDEKLYLDKGIKSTIAEAYSMAILGFFLGYVFGEDAADSVAKAHVKSRAEVKLNEDIIEEAKKDKSMLLEAFCQIIHTSITLNGRMLFNPSEDTSGILNVCPPGNKIQTILTDNYVVCKKLFDIDPIEESIAHLIRLKAFMQENYE